LVLTILATLVLTSNVAGQTPAAVRSRPTPVVANPFRLQTESANLYGRSLRSIVPEDSATVRKRDGAIVGGILGAVAGFAIANNYAGNHHPACVVVPAGGPCRYLQSDDASFDRIAGVAIGAVIGAFIGYVLER
jgi:hypothetical protein